MARAGVTVPRIVDVAMAVADRDGLDDLTLAAIAAELGIRVPSLYKHIPNLEAVVTLHAERCREQLADVMGAAIQGLSGQAAVEALANGIRTWALAYPARYGATVKGQVAGIEPSPATTRALAILMEAIGAKDEDITGESIHQARALRSKLHGFIDLELRGGFGIPVDIDESFAWLVRN